MTITILVNNRLWDKVLYPFIEKLQQLGIQVQIKHSLAGTYYPSLKQGLFDIVIMPVLWTTHSPSELVEHLLSSPIASLHIPQPNIQSLATYINQSSHPDIKRIVSEDILTQLTDEYWVVPLWYIDYYRLAYHHHIALPKATDEDFDWYAIWLK